MDYRTLRLISAVRAGRLALGATQEAFEVYSGVSAISIARFEAGLTSPRLSTVMKMIDALERYEVRISGIEAADTGGFTLSVGEHAVLTFGERFL